MGHIESKECNLFIQLLQKMIKSHGHDIKLKTVEEFVHIIREICPWVPEGGILGETAWHEIGEKIEQYASHNEALPQTEVLLSVLSKLKDSVCSSQAKPARPCSHNAISSPAAAFSPPASKLDPLDQMERGINHSSSRHSLMDSCQLVTEAVLKEPDRYVSPPNTPCRDHNPVTLTLPSDLSDQIRDLLSLCSKALTLQQQHCFPVAQAPSSVPSNSLVIRSTPTAPISPLTQAMMSMHKGFVDADSTSLYPLIEVTDNAGNVTRHYEAIPPKFLKDLKEAITHYGPIAPYTLSILENFSTAALPPAEWIRLTRACLSSGDFLLWKAYYDEAAFNQSERNRCASSQVTLDMLVGRGAFETLQNQIALSDEALLQINTLALKAWRQLPSQGAKTEELSKIRQGPDEPYQEFVSRLLEAITRQVGDQEASSMLAKQLAFENANAACQAAIRPWRRATISDYIRMCADIGTAYQNGLAMAAAQNGMTVAAFLKRQSQNSNIKCFRCGLPGHVAKKCPSRQQLALPAPAQPSMQLLALPAPPTSEKSKTRPPGECPRCHRGNHWANECRSKRDAQGNPLVPRLGNSQRGQPRPPQQIGAPLVQPHKSPQIHF
uniref:CCHC-type domain-containing protein n=1 Tax=Callithrix jacchus TaxID=9483 RepID=A0A5F4WFX3_CALJA